MKPKSRFLKQTQSLLTISLVLSMTGAAINSVQAQTTINYGNPAVYTEAAVGSTSFSPTITVADGSKFLVGGVVRFTGTSATTNPFNNAATNYYILSVSGNNITVSTTPGGLAVNAVNDTTASTVSLGQNLLVDTNWTGGTAPNSNSQIANFVTPAGGPEGFVINGPTPGAGQTLYGLTFNGNGPDLQLFSGWSGTGTGLNPLTLATNDASTPKLTLTGTTRVMNLGSTSANASKLAIAGNQGLIINSRQGGAVTGTGTAATSTVPAKNIRLTNVDWSGFSGGITVERGELNPTNINGTFPNQALTVGNAQTVTNNLLAGISLGAATTVVSLNGNSLGRVYGNNTLTVGNNNGTGGDFPGVIGRTFTGATTATNVTKIGTGTQTISGVMGGTGTLTVNDGILNFSGQLRDTGSLTSATGGTLNLSGTTLSGNLNYNGGTINVTGSVAGTTNINVNSGGTYLASTTQPYYGQTNINNGGTLQLGGANVLGSRVAPNQVLSITTTAASQVITVAPGSNIVIGSVITGTGIPVGTVVGAYDSATGNVTLSQAATASGTVSGTFEGIGAQLTSGSPTAMVAPGTPIQVGMQVSGIGIVEATRVTAYDSITGTVTLLANATSTSAEQLTFSGSTSLNTGGTLDLNGQTTSELLIEVTGSIINTNLSTPGVISQEIRQVGNPIFDGPGNIVLGNLIRTNGVTRRATKNGTGTLTLGGTQDNSRYGLTVNGGNVILAKTAGDAVGRFALIMNSGAGTVSLTVSDDQIANDQDQIHEINAGTIDLNGFNEGISSLSTTSGTEPGGTVTNSNGSTPSTFTLLGVVQAALPVDVTWPGTVTGNLNLVKQGGNTQTLTGTLSHTGDTTIDNGTLALGPATDLPNASTVRINGATSILKLTDGVTDTVAALVIDGDPKTGTWGATGSGAANIDDTHFSGTGVLSVGAVATPYDTWVALYQPGFTNNLSTQDQDGDGLTNQQEFAFGLNPKSGSSVNPITVGLSSATGNFSYTRNANSGLTYKVWSSTDLGTWTLRSGATQTPVGTPDAFGTQTVDVTTLGASPVNGKLFVRVTAE